MDNFDIYADLPDFVWLKQEYGAEVDVQKEELPTSEKDVVEMKTKLLKLEKVHKLVLSHYSSLWKTAKQERKRMERQITELRSQLDNLAFKRNRRQTNQNSVPFFVPVNAFPTSNNYQFNYPPPLMNQILAEQQVITNMYSYPPPSIHSALSNEQGMNQQEEIPNEHYINNLVVSSNVITPENSHSSDESEDEIVKKSEYRSTVYGERLRKKLLEEKRNAAKQKQESSLNEKKINETQLNHQKTKDSDNVHESKKMNALKDNEAVDVTQKPDARTIKEKNNNEKSTEIDAQNVNASCKQQELSNLNKIDVVVNTKNNEFNTENKNDNGRKKSDMDLMNRTGDDFKIKRERDINQRKHDERLKIERERDLERKREDESRTRRERDLERRRKEEEIDKARREEQFEKRRDEEIEKKRREQEVERRKKEDSDKRKREEVDRRRRDEEIERRKKEEIDKKRREEVDRKRREEEIERRRKEELEKRRREEIEKRRKDEEIERRKRDEIAKRRREEEAERRKNEEELHAIKLKEIEKIRNEKQLEELIKERERIEQEMKNMNEEETEEGEITESLDVTSCKEQNVRKKLQNHNEHLKETCRDKSKQSGKNQSDNRRNDDCKVSGRVTRSNSSRVTQPTINDSRRKAYHEHATSKSDRHQNNQIIYDRHSNLRSRRDQHDRERERRKSSHGNKSRNRNRNKSGHRSDEDRGNHSPKPKRIRLQEKDRDHRDKLKDTKEDRNSKVIEKSPKRRRQTKSNERSPHNNKKRKMSPGKDLDCNIESNKNNAPKINAEKSDNVDNGQNIVDNALSNQNTSGSTTDNVRNLKDNMREEKEKLVESLSKDQDEITNKLTNPQKETQIKNSDEDQVKFTNPQTDKKGINHANKMINLMNELFEVEEKSVGTLLNLNKMKNFEEISDETILTELEDGEISDSDESMNLKNTPRVVNSKTTNKIDTVNLLKQNKLEIVSSKDQLAPSLMKNNEEIVLKGSSSEVKDSILYNMQTRATNNNNEGSSMMQLNEQASKKTDAVVSENKDKSECCKNIEKNTDNTSPQIINEKQSIVNKTSHIEYRVKKSREIIETNDVTKEVLSEVNENKTVSEGSDKINTTIEKEKQITSKKHNDVEKPHSENSTKCISIATTSNILLEQLRQNCLKVNNSENKIDNEKRLQVKRTEIHSETNNIENTCLKENVKVNNDFTNKRIRQSVNNEKLHEESSKSVVKLKNTYQDNAAEKSVNTSLTLTTVKKIIVVRRRRRPVQLSDSPPVVVINNIK